MNGNVVICQPVIAPQEAVEVRTFIDPTLISKKRLEELPVEEVQKILIEDPPGGLD